MSRLPKTRICHYCGNTRRLVVLERMIGYLFTAETERATAYECENTSWYQLGHTKFVDITSINKGENND